MLEQDFYASGAEIIAQLREALVEDQTVKRVLSRGEMAHLGEERQIVPAIYVVSGGHQVVSSDEWSTKYSLLWFITIAVANKANDKEVVVADERAGIVANRMLAALEGFVPTGHSALVAQTAGRAYYSPGYAYYPFAFSTERIRCHTPNYR